MIKQFTLKKSSISNVQQQIDNDPANRQSGSPAVRQAIHPAGRQDVALNLFFVIITFSIVAIMPSFQTLKAQEICKL